MFLGLLKVLEMLVRENLTIVLFEENFFKSVKFELFKKKNIRLNLREISKFFEILRIMLFENFFFFSRIVLFFKSESL